MIDVAYIILRRYDTHVVYNIIYRDTLHNLTLTLYMQLRRRQTPRGEAFIPNAYILYIRSTRDDDDRSTTHHTQVRRNTARRACPATQYTYVLLLNPKCQLCIILSRVCVCVCVCV